MLSNPPNTFGYFNTLKTHSETTVILDANFPSYTSFGEQKSRILDFKLEGLDFYSTYKTLISTV